MSSAEIFTQSAKQYKMIMASPVFFQYFAWSFQFYVHASI